MFCRTCRRRETCAGICPRLERHLHAQHVYQKELPLDPDTLRKLAEHQTRSWPDLIADSPVVWEDLFELLSTLPSALVTPFLLHFHEGRGVNKLARELRLHRATLNRQLRLALTILQKEIAEKRKAAEREEEEV